jgi:hypothetical protein
MNDVYWLDDIETWVQIGKAQETSDGKWIIEGWASSSELDSENLRMSKQALEDMVREYGEMTTVLHNHNRDEEVGTILKAELRKKKEDVFGCWVKVLISKTVPKIWKKIQEKVINGFSVRGRARARELVENGRRIQEALRFEAAELSVVSVRALRGATIEEVYVRKFLNSLRGEQKMDEKIGLPAAVEAIKDLVVAGDGRDELIAVLSGEDVDLEAVKSKLNDILSEEEERKAVLKILDSVGEKEESSEVKDPVQTVKDSLDGLGSEERQKIAEHLASLAREEEEQEPPEKAVMESLAGGLKVLYERVSAAVKKSPEEAMEDLKAIEAAMKKLVEAYPYPYPAVKKTEEDRGEHVEEAKKEEKKVEKTLKEDELLNAFSDELTAIRKSLDEANENAKRKREKALEDMSGAVAELKAEVTKIRSTLDNEVPIRKALVEQEKERQKKDNPFDQKEFKQQSALDRLKTTLRMRTELAESD